MVARIAILLMLFTGFLPAIAASGGDPVLRILVGVTQGEYGKPLDLDLDVGDDLADIAALDLAPLDRDFVVDGIETFGKVAQSGRSRWRIRLYPRHEGEVLIPRLTWQGHHSETKKLMIGPAVSRRNGRPLRVEFEIGETNVWISQQLPVTVRVEGDDPFAALETSLTHHDDVMIVPSVAQRIAAGPRTDNRTRHQIGWSLYPRATGDVTIQLPPVSYRRDGVITHRFYPPRLALQVRPLPAFVPPTMWMGTLDLDVSLPRRLYIGRDELNFLSLRIRSNGPPGQYPASLLRQLSGNGDIRFYPPRQLNGPLSGGSSGDAALTWQVPFAATPMGLVSLPSLQIQYFDPASGKIVTELKPLGRVLVISPWLEYLLAAALLLGLFRLLKSVASWLLRKYRCWQAYRAALAALRQAATPRELRNAVMIIAGAEDWPTNLTLLNWLDRWSRQYPRLHGVNVSISRLQECLYGAGDVSLNDIRAALIDACYRRVPALRLLPL